MKAVPPRSIHKSVLTVQPLAVRECNALRRVVLREALLRNQRAALLAERPRIVSMVLDDHLGPSARRVLRVRRRGVALLRPREPRLVASDHLVIHLHAV